MSELLIAMTAGTSRCAGTAEDNIIELMIDSGAATHVCPQRFAPKFQLHALPKGDEPQLRTVTSTRIKVHGFKYAAIRNNKQHPILIPQPHDWQNKDSTISSTRHQQ